MRANTLLVALLSILGAATCSESSPNSPWTQIDCKPNQRTYCLCPDNTPGMHVCTASRTFGPCEPCDGSGGSGAASGSGAAAGLAGSAGVAGSGLAAGAAGSAGVAGSAGASATGGQAGIAGQAGAAGEAGTAGLGGSGGADGTGGAAGSSGAAGTSADPCSGQKNGHYCGYSLSYGDPDTLYYCSGDMLADEQACQFGCSVNMSVGCDTCMPSANCVQAGDPCGGSSNCCSLNCKGSLCCGNGPGTPGCAF